MDGSPHLPALSIFCQASVPKPIEMAVLPPQGNRSCLVQLLSSKQRSSGNVSALQALGPRNMNLGLEEQRLPGAHWQPCTSSCQALTCLCSCWEAAEPSHCPSDTCPCSQTTGEQQPGGVGALGISECLWWVRRRAEFAWKVKQHWQTCTIKCSSFFSSQRKKRLEEVLCCA